MRGRVDGRGGAVVSEPVVTFVREGDSIIVTSLKFALTPWHKKCLEALSIAQGLTEQEYIREQLVAWSECEGAISLEPQDASQLLYYAPKEENPVSLAAMALSVALLDERGTDPWGILNEGGPMPKTEPEYFRRFDEWDDTPYEASGRDCSREQYELEGQELRRAAELAIAGHWHEMRAITASLVARWDREFDSKEESPS